MTVIDKLRMDRPEGRANSDADDDDDDDFRRYDFDENDR